MIPLQVTISGGHDRSGRPERVRRLELAAGDTLAVVGPTGSGKSLLLSDIEQAAEGDTPSGRQVAIAGWSGRNGLGAVATLSQRTNFLMDTDVRTFVAVHAACLAKDGTVTAEAVVALANTLCGEPIRPADPLQGLSGGQTRALMIADIALISDAPVILLDELENAGIDKHKALATLSARGKIIITATHDPLLVLMSRRRLVMRGGGMSVLHEIDTAEAAWRDRLSGLDALLQQVRDALRDGDRLGPGTVSVPACSCCPET
ncbi:MAG: ATP-binding cassette domain-containing protein [Telmatospirillum sp.]|nr:ATP-binding cassette domain-containing protein [Telmatospirillum sp.]